MIDYHMHCMFSFDSEEDPAAMASTAKDRGFSEICFTDHVDFDGDKPESLPDLAGRTAYFQAHATEFSGIRVKLGVEVSLMDEESAKKSDDYIRASMPDFIIASLHVLEGADVWADAYYIGLAKEEAYAKYLRGLARAVKTCSSFSVLGHYDFVAKYAPYSDRSVLLAHEPDSFDDIFRYLISNGKGLEINTASWQGDALWGFDILRRYEQLGGEFITAGSDTHSVQRVGKRIPEALALASAAGIKYYATFDQLKPVFHKIG